MRSTSRSLRLPLVITGLVAASLAGLLWMAFAPQPAQQPGTGHILQQSAPPASPEPPAAPAPEPDAAPDAARPLDAPVIAMGPDMIILRVIDAETRAPVTSYDVSILRHDGTPPLPRADDPEQRIDNPVVVRGPTGIFKSESKAGHWDLVVHAPDYEPGVALDLVVPPLDARPVELPLTHGPGLTGMVYDDDAQPVPDVAVYLLVDGLSGDATPPGKTVARTGSDGRFRFSPLPPGQYSIAALEPGNLKDHLGGLVVQQGTTDVSLYLAPRHNVLFQVQDAAGRPVAGIDVELRGDQGIAATRTAESGQAYLRYVSDGTYALRIAGAGYESQQEDFVLSGGQGEQVRWITLQPLAGG